MNIINIYLYINMNIHNKDNKYYDKYIHEHRHHRRSHHSSSSRSRYPPHHKSRSHYHHHHHHHSNSRKDRSRSPYNDSYYNKQSVSPKAKDISKFYEERRRARERSRSNSALRVMKVNTYNKYTYHYYNSFIDEKP